MQNIFFVVSNLFFDGCSAGIFDFDVFVTGPDQNHAGFQTAIKWCQQNGKEHVILSRTEGISSSLLKRSIAEQNQKK